MIENYLVDKADDFVLYDSIQFIIRLLLQQNLYWITWKA